MRLSASQVTWFRLRRSGLVNPFSSAAQAAGRLVGVQGQIHSAPALALWNRVADFTLQKFEAALYRRRTLVKLWGQRNTLHVYRSTEWPLITAALRDHPTWLERAIAREGVDDEPYHQLLHTLERRLAKGGTITRADMRDMRMVQNEEWLTWGGVIMRLVRDGTVCHGKGEGGETHFVHRAHWVPRLAWNPPATGVAQCDLVRRFVSTYGPITPQDFAYWLGVKIGEAQQWIARAKQELTEVEVDGVEMLALRKDRMALREAPPTADQWPVCLLYRFDPLLLALKNKDWIVAKEHYARVWRPGGHIEGTVMVRDRVRGTWRYDRAGGGVTVTVRPFGKLSQSVLRTVRIRANGVARFFGGSLAEVTVQ